MLLITLHRRAETVSIITGQDLSQVRAGGRASTHTRSELQNEFERVQIDLTSHLIIISEGLSCSPRTPEGGHDMTWRCVPRDGRIPRGERGEYKGVARLSRITFARGGVASVERRLRVGFCGK